VVPQVVRDCARKGIPGVMINAAGFAETGTEAGKALEKEVLGIAHEAGIRIIGPNCLGIYNPRISLGYLDAPELVGRVGVVAQSGSMTVRIVKFGVEHGVGFSKAISSGNESDLTLVDYIEYFGQDAETAIISLGSTAGTVKDIVGWLSGGSAPPTFRELIGVGK
jgi:acetyltransferase